MNKIILYIATSLDSFIADINGGVDWLPHPKDNAELEAVGYKDLMERIDTILMGSRSYKQILGFGDWGWSDKHTYVFTSKKLETDKPYISMTHDSPLEFMAKLKDRKSDKDIWLLGGAQLAQSFAQEGLIDEIILTITPQTLEEGIPLGLTFQGFDLTSQKALTDGMTQKVYRKKNHEHSF
jgi:dihydrofolate reductase